MRCPACGHEQSVAETCGACGIRFEDFNRDRHREAAPAGQRPARGRGPADWGRDWGGFEESDIGTDEDVCLTLFVGPEAPRYLDAFRRLRADGRVRWVPGWNWGVVISPFLWTLYRRLWGWSAVLALLDVVFPLAFVMLGGRLPGAAYLVPVGLALLLGNRLVWPALADYLYLRHARATLGRLDRMSATRMHESEIVAAGGVSIGGVLAGIVLSGAVLLWLADFSGTVQPTVTAVSDEPASSTNRPAEEAREIPADGGLEVTGRWRETHEILNGLAERIAQWAVNEMAAEGRPESLTIRRLHADVGIAPGEMLDAWANNILFIPAAEGFRLVSAGPDRLFGTADDIQLRRQFKP
jgi:hypothetical protein